MMDWIQGLLNGSAVSGGIFLLIGIVGAVLLLISLLLDGIFDAFDLGDGPLSLTSIAAFTAIFGFSAFALVGAGLAPSMAGALGGVAGLIGGALAWWLSRFVRSSESSTAVSSGELAGLEASVVLGIPGGSRFGEIALSRHGERVSLSACAALPLERGVRVRIVDSLTPTSVLVEPLVPAPMLVEPLVPGPANDPAPRADPAVPAADATGAADPIVTADPTAIADPIDSADPTDHHPERN